MTGTEMAADAGATEVAAPAAPAVSQAGEQRSARVESLRAIGALGVIVSHIFLVNLGFKGVDSTYVGSYQDRLFINSGYLGLYLFFALSGYLLFLPFARHQLQGRAINVRSYARNRALRILPLYFSAIAVLFVVYPVDVDRGEWWRFALLIQSYSPETINKLNAPLWTIPVEIQFYVVLPMLAWVIAQFARRSIRYTVVILLGIALVSFAVRAHEVLGEAEPNVYGVLGKYALPSNLYGFIVGMLIAIARLAWERRPPGWAARPLLGTSSVWIGVAILLYLVVTYNFDWQEPTLALSAFLILSACVLPLRGGRLVRALEWRPLATLGIATFSLYVWHAPVLYAVVEAAIEEGRLQNFKALLALGVPLCIAVGGVSYLLVERPFLRRRQGWGATAAPRHPVAEPPRAE